MRRGLEEDRLDGYGFGSLCHASTNSEQSPQETRAPGQDFGDLGPSLTPFGHMTSADSALSGLGFPTCTLELGAFNSPLPLTFHEPTDGLRARGCELDGSGLNPSSACVSACGTRKKCRL